MCGDSFKAFSEYSKGNFDSAYQILTNNDKENSELFYKVFLNNNIGILKFSMKKIGISEHYFQSALKLYKQIYSNINPIPLHSQQQQGYLRSAEILYNLGLAKLHLGKSKQAFDCLLVVLRIYHNNPRLWLRVAEACIMHSKGQQANLDENVEQKEMINLNRKHRIFYDSNNASSRAIPAPTIEFASFCLSNCLKLLEEYQVQHLEEDFEDFKNVEYNICNPSTNLTPEILNKLLACAYLNSSYVALELGDYIAAIKYSKDLLKIEEIPVSYKYLGRMYAGKALINLNDVVGGQKQFNLENDFIDKMLDTKESQPYFISSPDNLNIIMKYNSLIADVLLGKEDVQSKISKLKKHPCISSRIK